jgi:hypothetical protein
MTQKRDPYEGIRDGWEFAEEVKARPPHWSLWVIVLTLMALSIYGHYR